MRPPTGTRGVGGVAVTGVIEFASGFVKMVKMFKGFEGSCITVLRVAGVAEREEIVSILKDIIFFKGSSGFTNGVTFGNSGHLLCH